MKTFDQLFAELAERQRTRPGGSGTVVALDAGVHEQGKKVVEEAAEGWMVAGHQAAARTGGGGGARVGGPHGRGGQPAPLPGQGDHAGQGSHARGRLPTSLGGSLGPQLPSKDRYTCSGSPSRTRARSPSRPARCSSRRGTASAVTAASSSCSTPTTTPSSSSCALATSPST